MPNKFRFEQILSVDEAGRLTYLLSVIWCYSSSPS